MRGRSLAGLSLLLLLPMAAASAATIHVPGDQPTIQAGIDAAAPGDTVQLAALVFTGPGNTDLGFGGKDIVLRGAALPDSSAIDCQDQYQGFYLNEGETAAARIERLTIKNTDGYAFHAYQASATLTDIRLFDCSRGVAFHTSTSAVHGLLCVRTSDALGLYAATATATNLDVRDGGLYNALDINAGSSLSVDGLRVTGSRARYGVVDCAGTLVLRNAFFSGNSLSQLYPRGVIYGHGDGSSLDLQWVTLVDNATDGIRTEDACALTARNVTIARTGGEGFELSAEGTADIAEVIVAFSTKVGIFAWSGGTVTLACSDVYGNALGDFGGALADPTGSNGMIKAEPMFCQLGGPDQPPTLSVNSPCAPANNDCGLLMGAHGTACDLEMVTVSGSVLDAASQPVVGVAIEGFYDPLLTDAAGHYAFDTVQGWSGVLQPVRVGLHFDPMERAIGPLTDDLPDQDFLAFAQTAIRVPQDFATLAEALDFALDGDSVLVAPGTYTGPGNRNLGCGGKAIAVLGLAGAEATILDCQGQGRAFTLLDGETPATLIGGLTIRNGHSSAALTPPYPSGGGIYVQDSSPTLRDLIIEDCQSDAGGGGLLLLNSSALVERVHCRGNEAPGLEGIGGGAFASHGAPTFRDCLFTDNFAFRYGGGLHITDGTIRVEGCTVVGNTAGWSGGGISSYRSSSPPQLIITRSLIAYNHATSGGALFNHALWPAPAYDCCLLWGNDSPRVWGTINDPVGTDGNIAVDPLLCDPGGGDFGLQAGSPCLPENNACGVRIGALGEGCGALRAGGER